MKKDIILIIDITFCIFVIFSFDSPIRDFIANSLNLPFMNYTIGHSIERDGFVGCDTVPIPGDKEQIAAAFMANVDTIWRTLNKVDKNGFINKKSEYVYDPAIYYSHFCYLTDYKRYSKNLLPKSPNNYYQAFTDLIVYSKDKLLCMAFVVIRQDVYDGRDELPPYFECYAVIGKRDKKDNKFKIFLRFGNSSRGSTMKDAASCLEDMLLYSKGSTYSTLDIFSEEDYDKLPVLSDSDFFEKHPLFDKFDDSTYMFELYRRENKPEKYFRYNYPY